ncbi:MAG: 50S ribosomal protein L23 [Gemmatimonadota bacterium]|nr:50S ribosomal protein L23 [Gemmatimonadota bacterium]
MPPIHETIVRPVITEKTSLAYQRSNERGELEYTFQVHPDATKPAIRQAVEQLFGVKVVGVWTSNHRGKTKRVGRTTGRRANFKKAIVRLAEGDKIDVFGFEG